ncbi:MAG: hypothetical protein A2857_00605 [Candidatus Levybacteria bacterium RIFCSPHIGHO2_01_FULL_36_15]|nr:MAG: hypothetical protein A2857_00605 [Candidatus Levybacteria bacterium RIFCSPHIGHO2_01_FULL_36_15]OGH38759.1 MAG: hypothetical protein A2905_06275 [Candidatus Levybacteria bacterium RIFCSPLOWO2_01_FULL_36_10]
MFQSARLKLAAWYLLIIMSISVLFSAVIYKGATLELERSLRAQQFRIFRDTRPGSFSPFSFRPPPDEQLVNEAKERIRLVLALINLGILIVSGGAGYFLAGRTLKPIRDMVEEQNRFVADASHELRTPLTSLRSEIEVYMRGKKHNIKEADTLLKSNLEEVNSLQVLSDDLILLAQYQKTNNPNTFREITLTEVIRIVRRKLHALIQKKKIDVRDEINDVKIIGDKDSLVQLFTILLDNAIKYSPKKSTVNITSKIIDNSVVADITDQGIGIADKDIPHIFDRFYRADISRTKQKISGYGLGLSIAKKIIDNHKGTISVKSEIGKGSTFTVHLPRVKND